MKNVEFVLDGVDPERRSDAERDLRQVLDVVFDTGLESVKRVTLALDFAQAVTDTARELCELGDSGYEPNYKDHRAIGKLLSRASASSYEAYILIDADGLEAWTPAQQAVATQLVLHEAFHAELQQQAYMSLGLEYFGDLIGVTDPANAWYRWMAQIWIEEYLVHQREVQVHPRVFQSEEGNPITAQDHYSRWYGGDFVEAIVEEFEILGHDLVDSVERYRRHQFSLHEMWFRVRRSFRIALVTHSLVLALYPPDELRGVIWKLASTSAFRLFFGRQWHEVEAEFGSAARRAFCRDAEAIEQVAKRVEWILRRVGIRLYSTDVGGLGMDVFEPALPWPNT